MLKTAIILAGGFGTRLQNVISDVPKPMAPVYEQPFLNYLFKYLKHYSIRHAILSTGYLSQKIEEYYGKEFNDIKITYSVETSPLGTGGAIKKAMGFCDETLSLVLNGDSFFDVDLSRFYDLHKKHHSRVSLALCNMSDAARYGTVITDADHTIVSFKEKNNLPQKGIINGGVYILDKKTYLENTPASDNFSIEKDFFEKQLHKIAIKGFEFDSYFIDIGIPEDYAKAQDDFKGFKYK